jgi:hypothetical protein
MINNDTYLKSRASLLLPSLARVGEWVFVFRAKPEKQTPLPFFCERSEQKKTLLNMSSKVSDSFKASNTFIALTLVICLFFTSCVKENAVPSYIHIPSFSLNVKGGEGTSAQKITDAWVYVDGQINGVFQIPVTLPIVEVGQHEISIIAGIRNNGTKSNAVIYPFFNTFTLNMDLKAGKVDTLRPVTSYIPNTQYKILEDFETGNTLRIDRDGNTALRFIAIDNGFEGKCGQIVLTKAQPKMEKASVAKADLSSTAENIYLEMHYKTETELSVGIVGSDMSNPSGIALYKITLFPSKEWNKTYINLTNESKDLRMKDFQLVFRSLLPDSLNSATILIDNLKLIQK